jgi:hypothetical protein
MTFEEWWVKGYGRLNPACPVTVKDYIDRVLGVARDAWDAGFEEGKKVACREQVVGQAVLERPDLAPDEPVAHASSKIETIEKLWIDNYRAHVPIFGYEGAVGFANNVCEAFVKWTSR